MLSKKKNTLKVGLLKNSAYTVFLFFIIVSQPYSQDEEKIS